ncbi:MAG: hypothetical protein COU11_01590 [Candidatus Harrisonbacteria bacterium CG10_big_fil_rev_8_21_14_0_10_49_15]|uniref:Uncharacterized protein n=1 Tax=Candidatus Harrisonbacteria bacterium CG10_big_fil_rev_8_21_14_0_10_49_15 TaxID=1974587 RepID=A0A2H0ULF7_9BACT|nr:MAG: hypothetical protein COU11_01590 [Candidatus Harrisonbacteria bacterium CG10_big_fil_rev_8_21_14_0_10_49_15]
MDSRLHGNDRPKKFTSQLTPRPSYAKVKTGPQTKKEGDVSTSKEKSRCTFNREPRPTGQTSGQLVWGALILLVVALAVGVFQITRGLLQ